MIAVAGSGLPVLLGTLVGVIMILLAAGATYLYGWRKPPNVTVGVGSSAGQAADGRSASQSHGPMYEANIPDAELESVENDAFDPVGTLLIIAVYAGIIALAWLFMYFVEFLGNGPTVVG